MGLGDASEGARLRLSVHELSPGDRISRDETAVRPDPRPRVLTIGRDPSCDVALRDPMVSVRRFGRGLTDDVLWVEDLGSSNDTLVNGASVQRHQLREGDRLLIGNTHLVYDRGRVIPIEGEGFVVEHATLTIRGGRRIVDDVSISITRPSVAAVIGPSGAGKSSLLRMATGQVSPSSGAVTLNGATMTRHRHAHRGQVGVVPQHTVAHGALTARQALEYTARLRLSTDVSLGTAPAGLRRSRAARAHGPCRHPDLTPLRWTAEAGPESRWRCSPTRRCLSSTTSPDWTRRWCSRS